MNTALEDGPTARIAVEQPERPPAGAEAFSLFADVPVVVEVELDRKVLAVRDLLRLAPGSVLKMNRSAGENIDIRVGGVLMGFGEIVILEERMGVRITDFAEQRAEADPDE